MAALKRAQLSAALSGVAAFSRGVWIGRWSDGLNPIFVRDMTRALSTPWFIALVALPVLAAVGVFAPILSQSLSINATPGREALVAIERFVVWPIVLIELPFRTFMGTKADMIRPASDDLRAANVESMRILAGRFMMATTTLSLRLTALGPLFGYAYSLRGISLFDVAGVGVRAVVACTLLTTCAYACGTLAARNARGAGLAGFICLIAWIVSTFVALVVVTEPNLPRASYFSGIGALTAMNLSNFFMSASAHFVRPCEWTRMKEIVRHYRNMDDAAELIRRKLRINAERRDDMRRALAKPLDSYTITPPKFSSKRRSAK